MIFQFEPVTGERLSQESEIRVGIAGGPRDPDLKAKIESPINFFDDWTEVPDAPAYDNAFKAQWELFLRHVVNDEPFPWNLMEGAKGVQLAEKGLESWERRAWVNIPELE